MDVKQAYNIWASQYDTNDNRTRDLEGKALRQTLASISFDRCLEIGCGTGKNTQWLVEKAKHVTAVDLSEQMLARAKEKVISGKVEFVQSDIKEEWLFKTTGYDLVTFSLVLEHIEDLDHIFKQVSQCLDPGGYAYVGELHPYKQYGGTKARFDTESGRQIVQCYNHHISDFIVEAKKNGLALVDMNEYFDDDNRDNTPRILVILFRKK